MRSRPMMLATLAVAFVACAEARPIDLGARADSSAADERGVPDGVPSAVDESEPGPVEIAPGAEATSVPPSCASVVVAEGDSVIPQTTLHLRASDAPEPTARFAWRVDQPPGAASRFLPSEAAASPVFEANVAGRYTFYLTLTDAFGAACEAAPVTVDVVPDEALHIELLWHTPGDLDESDEGDGLGSDLDLHLLLGTVPGAYEFFDLIFDTFFANGSPNWGRFGASDDPHIDRDDTDVAGPENLNLTDPPPLTCYTIGVYVHSDGGYGPSVATVRLYRFGVLAFEATGPGLVANDLWTVTTFCWPIASAPLVRRVCAGTRVACGTSADCVDGVACALDIVQHPRYD